MTVLIIFAILTGIALYLVLSAIKLRLRFNDSEWTIIFSYTLFSLRLQINKMEGRIHIAGIGIKKFKLSGEGVASQTKKIADKARKEEGKKGSEKFSFSDIISIFNYMKKLRYTIGHIRVKHLKIDLWDGFSNPYNTGRLYALFTAAKGIFPHLLKYVTFKPDFSADSLKIRGEGLVLLKMLYILIPVLQMLTDKIKESTIAPSTRLKKGTSYG